MVAASKKKLVPTTLGALLVRAYNNERVTNIVAAVAKINEKNEPRKTFFDSSDLDAETEASAIRKAHISHRSRWRSK